MNQTNPIPGFRPRLMGSLAGLMLLSGVFALLPAQAPNRPVLTRAEAASMPNFSELRWDAEESDRILEYSDAEGNPFVVLLSQLLYPNDQTVKLRRDVPSVIDAVEAHFLRAHAAGDREYVEKTLRRIETFHQAFDYEKDASEDVAWAAGQFKALSQRLLKSQNKKGDNSQ